MATDQNWNSQSTHKLYNNIKPIFLKKTCSANDFSQVVRNTKLYTVKIHNRLIYPPFWKRKESTGEYDMQSQHSHVIFELRCSFPPLQLKNLAEILLTKADR